MVREIIADNIIRVTNSGQHNAGSKGISFQQLFHGLPSNCNRGLEFQHFFEWPRKAKGSLNKCNDGLFSKELPTSKGSLSLNFRS